MPGVDVSKTFVTIDVVLTSHNGDAALRRSLEALDAQEMPCARLHVLVPPAGFDAARAAVERRDDTTVAPFDEGGRAPALNGALSGSRADLVAILCDCVAPHASWLRVAADRAREHPDEGMWASVVLSRGTVGLVESAGVQASRGGVPYLAGRGTALWSARASAPAPLGFDSRSAFLRTSALAGRDAFATNRVVLAADFDLALRLRASGVGCALLHEGRVTSTENGCPAHAPQPSHALERDAVLSLVGVMPPAWLAAHLPGHAASGIAGAFRKPWRKTSWRSLGAKLGVMAGLPGAALRRIRGAAARDDATGALGDLFADPPPAPSSPGETPATASTAESELMERERSAERETENRVRAVTLRVRDAAGKVVSRARVAVEQVASTFRFGADVSFMDLIDGQPFVSVATALAATFNAAHIDLAARDAVDLDALARRVAWCREAGLTVCVSVCPTTAGAALHEAATRLGDAIAIWEVAAAPRDLGEALRYARQLAEIARGDVMLTARGVPGYFDAVDAALDAMTAARTALPRLVGLDMRLPRGHRTALDHVRWTIDRFATLGREVHVKGVSPPAAGPLTGSHVAGTWDEAAQAEYAEQLYRVCHSHPDVAGIWWGEVGPWTHPGGLWRADSTARPVHEKIASLIGGEWRARATVETGADGRAAFTGRFGSYRAALQPVGTPSGSFELTADGAAELDVRLG